MAAVVAEADGTAGHKGDGGPEAVQVSATGLAVAGAGCPFALLAAPQADTNIRARIKLVRRMPIGCGVTEFGCMHPLPLRGEG
jgi:hypothetical protein